MTDISQSRAKDFAPGDIYEDVLYHPCLAMGVSEEDDEIWGVSLIDGSYPRCCSLTYSGIRKLSTEEAWYIKQNYAQILAEAEEEHRRREEET